MSYAVLSLPTVKDLKSSKYYADGAFTNLVSKAGLHAERRGLVRGVDYEFYQPGSLSHLDTSLDEVRRYSLVYVDAHGDAPSEHSEQVPSTIDVPGSTNDPKHRQDVFPSELGFRKSSIELLIAGICYQDPKHWEYAVPPGCVVIGFRGYLSHTHFRHMFERFVDLRQLLKEDRSPQSHESQEWLDHILEWFECYLVGGATRTQSSDWFIAVGKD